MEPNNIENKIREKLGSREINPSENSWDRLDAMLTVQEPKGPRKSYVMLYVAAAFFLVSGIVVWFNSNTTTEIITNATPVVIAPETLPENIQEMSVENNVPKAEVVKAINTTNVIFEKTRIAKVDTEENVVQENEFNKSNILTKEQLTKVKYQYVTPEQLLAAVDVVTTDSTIELKNETKEVPKVKVNSNALLTAVESEIAIEYRENSFDRIQRNLNEVKAAFANRNYK
ncbi:hypothetical protein ACFS5J_07145 [Flavobacterium chuncheonense]|uniref:Anti-sigma factor n=1 Tax=Flavobacterium chuncheonense TaxID=2026653 RepID=A0ABW5YL94_9FLAO